MKEISTFSEYSTFWGNYSVRVAEEYKMTCPLANIDYIWVTHQDYRHFFLHISNSLADCGQCLELSWEVLWMVFGL